jgi:hypothetical protein
MNEKTFVRLTGAIFALVALAHLGRIAMAWPVVIGGWAVPLWLSWLAVLVAGGLGYFGFTLGRRT